MLSFCKYYFSFLIHKKTKYIIWCFLAVCKRATHLIGHVGLEFAAVISVHFIHGISGMNETFYYWFTRGTFDEWSSCTRRRGLCISLGVGEKRNWSLIIYFLLFLFFSVKLLMNNFRSNSSCYYFTDKS